MAPSLHAATNPREACGQIAKGHALLIAGGTLLMNAINNEDTATTALVDLAGLGLRGIKISGQQATIGAMTTMADIAQHPKLKFLSPVARAIGGPAVRNMATVGGNLHADAPYGDLGVALLALDARVTIETARQKKTLTLEEFYRQRGKLGSYVLTAVIFKLPPPNSFHFAKAIRRKPVSASVISIAAVLPLKAKKLSAPLIAYGAMAPHPIRAKAAEQVLDGKGLDKATIEKVVAVATKDCAPETDPYATAWYRREVAPVYLERLLSQAGKVS